MLTLMILHLLFRRPLFKPGEMTSSLRAAARLSVLLIAAWLGSSRTCHGQTLEYDIIRHGSSIGRISLHRQALGDSVNYSLESEARVRLLLQFRIVTHLKATFVADRLVAYRSLQKLNNKIRKDGAGSWSSHGFLQTEKGLSRFTPNDPVTFSVTKMYFEEPAGVFLVYSELTHDPVTLSQIGEHVYRLTFESGDVSDFEYSAGRCVRVRVTTQWSNAEFRLRETPIANRLHH